MRCARFLGGRSLESSFDAALKRARCAREHIAADPGKSGSALPPERQSMPIIDACSGTSCKFLQAVARPGAISHERHRPVGPVRGFKSRGVQPALSAALAAGSVRRSAVTSNFLRRIVGVMFLRVNSNPPTRCAHRLESEAQQSSASNVSRSPAGQHGEREGAPALGRRLTLLRIRSKRGCNLELQRAARSQHCGLRERRPYR
jgi:hypothetical protein